MKEILILITENFADWETAHVSTELNKEGSGYKIRTVSINKQPKKSMGGFTILPDYDITEAIEKVGSVAMLIIVGGTSWKETENHKAIALVQKCVEEFVPIAAICDAVTFIAGYGYLDHVKHTGNTVEYIKMCAPGYQGEQNYIEAQSVLDGNFITANGTGNLEFGRNILLKLKLLTEEKSKEWYYLWKNGYYDDAL